MITNDIKKGAKLVLTGHRTATMMDNKKGIIRMVETDAVNGWYNEIGSVYVNEIVLADDQAVEIVPTHRKQLERIGQLL